MPALPRQLKAYRSRRDFDRTPEPAARQHAGHSRPIFVVQKHHARQLHYDFRLEVDGVLKSWAVPKGPSLNPADRRLAVAVEDHPLEYAKFEGVIPAGQYGAGEVIVWDRGTYRLDRSKGATDPLRALRSGSLSIVLRGKKLKGGFSLVRMKQKRQWLLIKHDDEYASRRDVTREAASVRSGRTLRDLKRARKR